VIRSLSQIDQSDVVLPSWMADVASCAAVMRKAAFEIITSAIDGDSDVQKCAAVARWFL
jgi:hypothetical protein